MSMVYQSVRASGLPLVVVALLAFLLSACSTANPALPGPSSSARCAVASTPQPSGLTVGVTEPIDFARAPLPHNSSEQIVFAQLYETLVMVDCTGALRPGLAASWSSTDNGRIWQFRLRADAAFWDGSPVIATAIASAWSGNPRVAPLIASVTAPNANTLRVEPQQPAASPELFAHPQLAIVRSSDTTPWPLGTGPLRPSEANANVVRLASADGQRTIDFRSYADARRALDANVDVLVSGDAAALDYARALTGYTLTALPWSRTYALVTRGESADTSAPPADALSSLARDAVRADARPAEPPFWWRDAQCVSPTARSTTVNPARARTIAYPRGDAFARALAERVVALAWPIARAPAWLSSALPLGASGSPPTASAVNPAAQLDALNSGTALGLVLPLPRSAGQRCPARFSTDSLGSALTVSGYRITPLLDARSYLIHRANVGTVLLDGNGTLRFAPRDP